MKKIMVTGVTGPLGLAVAESLLNKTSAAGVLVLSRNPSKAQALAEQGIEVRKGDYDDYDSLVAAFQGIDKLYFVSGNDIANRMSQHENVVKAAKTAGVKHVVYTSFLRKDETDASPIAFVAKSHLFTERLLEGSGLTYTILQHGIYTDMIPVFVGPQLLETKTLYQPAGDGRTSFAVRTDLAEAGANILLDDKGRYDNKALVFTGPETVSYHDVAQIISGVTGLPIGYYSPSLEEFKETMTAAGLPGEVITIVAGFATAIKKGEFDQVTGQLEELLGRKPVTVAQFLTDVYKTSLAVPG